MAATLESHQAARDDATHPTGQPRATEPRIRTDPDLSNQARERAESHALTAANHTAVPRGRRLPSAP